MRDRKRVFDSKNIGKLEQETIAFFKDNINRFATKNQSDCIVAKTPKEGKKKKKKKMKKREEKEIEKTEKKMGGCSEKKLEVEEEDDDVKELENNWSIKL